MEVKICSIDGKHILNIFLKSVVGIDEYLEIPNLSKIKITSDILGIYAQLDMAKNQDKHILWIYFGTKRH